MKDSAIMEIPMQDSVPECQICFNLYGPRRRPKVLDCRHTCCSVCLTQMWAGQRELRCPWCRAVTRLPPGVPVSHLPDDPDALAAIAIQRSEHASAVFIRLPSDGCYALPLPIGPPGDRQQKGVAVVAVPLGERERERERGREESNGAAWSGVCTVLLVAFILLFLLIIVLHNMSCVSKRFTVISCG